jgi:hypothetical protein
VFTIDQSETYTWPVTFMVPGDGVPVEVSFTGKFARISQSDYEKMLEEKWDDRRVAERVLVGWGADVTDGKGKPVEFNAATFSRLLDVAGARGAIVSAFLAVYTGEALRKNS